MHTYIKQLDIIGSKSSWVPDKRQGFTRINDELLLIATLV